MNKGFMLFADAEGLKRCSRCNDNDVVQKSLDGGYFCQRCWEQWMGEPTGVISIENGCKECGRVGDTPRYMLRNGGHRVCCSACFEKEFGDLPIMVEEIEIAPNEIELIPHNPHKRVRR